MRPIEALRMQERVVKDMVSMPRWNTLAEFYTQMKSDAWTQERRVLSKATTYFVANQMNPLLEMGFRDLDDEIRIQAYHLPSPVGFCMFDEPLSVGGRTMLDRAADDHTTTHGIRAFSWVTTTVLDDLDRYPMITPEAGQRSTISVLCTGYIDSLPTERHIIGDLTPVFTAGLYMDSGLGGLRTYLRGRWGETFNEGSYIKPSTLTRATGIDQYAEDVAAEGTEADIDAEVEETINHCKLMMDVWFMMSQHVVEVVPTTGLPSGKLPPLIKQGKRKVRAKMPEVRVINLRRKELVNEREAERDQEHQAREWKHQWIVKGHWRSQPYGEGRKLRRPVYIHPHIKGPVDAPLLDNKKVYRLSQ